MALVAGAKPTEIAVIGLGAWGSALAQYCAQLGHHVTAWHRDDGHLAAIRSAQEISIAKDCRVPLPTTMRVTSNLADCRAQPISIIALPASAWPDVLPTLKPQGLVVSASKGLERTAQITPLTWCHRVLGVSSERLCVISGPSFARDLAQRTPITLVAASGSEDTAALVAKILSSSSVRVYVSNDPLGVELGGILKNVIAIAVGISDALGYGPSTRAALITRGLSEMTRVAVALGAQHQTLSGLSGLGDLVMTATDDQSRNRIVGLRLGRGEKLSEILSSLGSTAEGVLSAPIVETIAREKAVDAPIISLVVKVLRGEIAPKDLAATLMTRPLKGEFS
ncbi:MAG: NAD(P)H-dependent glycerol-3-phosphate dehydrogenase [Pseudomonadota bacterium]|jgi:glycerol-3-phosphate dehydrogenase (NAD(P)+)